MKIKYQPISKKYLNQYLTIPDLTDRKNGEEHAIYKMYRDLLLAIQNNYSSELLIRRSNPITSVVDNFDNLQFPSENLSRSSTYAHYIDRKRVLRTHTSAMVPPVLRSISDKKIKDTILILPGLVYRRDVKDKTHLGVFHQVDVWRITKNAKSGGYNRNELLQLVDIIFQSLMPGYKPIIIEAQHPYTLNGIEVYADVGDDQQLEILEAGIAHPEVLRKAGIDPEEYTGLALGFGLDRTLMVRKGLPDIRIIRASDSRIASQLNNLEKYISVSNMPAIVEDISYSVPQEYTEEDISQQVIMAAGKDIDMLESVELLSETNFRDLHPRAVEKLGISENQKNVLVRISYRSLERTLTQEEVNTLKAKIYNLVNQGVGGYI